MGRMPNLEELRDGVEDDGLNWCAIHFIDGIFDVCQQPDEPLHMSKNDAVAFVEEDYRLNVAQGLNKSQRESLVDRCRLDAEDEFGYLHTWVIVGANANVKRY